MFSFLFFQDLNLSESSRLLWQRINMWVHDDIKNIKHFLQLEYIFRKVVNRAVWYISLKFVRRKIKRDINMVLGIRRVFLGGIFFNCKPEAFPVFCCLRPVFLNFFGLKKAAFLLFFSVKCQRHERGRKLENRKLEMLQACS